MSLNTENELARSENGPVNQGGHLSEKDDFPCVRMHSLTPSCILLHDTVGTVFSPVTIVSNDHKQFYDFEHYARLGVY